jgi:hypothetical protein
MPQIGSSTIMVELVCEIVLYRIFPPKPAYARVLEDYAHAQYLLFLILRFFKKDGQRAGRSTLRQIYCVPGLETVAS